MATTVYARLVKGLKPCTRPWQLRAREHKVEFVSAETEQKALDKLTGRNQGWQIVYYEVTH